MPNRIPWIRVIAEAGAIVLSILLAFAIQAWWEQRAERIAETEYLEAIRDEIDDNMRALEANVRVAGSREDGLRHAIQMLEDGAHADSASAFVSSIVAGALSAGPPRVSTAVFDELTSTGRVVLIQDVALRREILGIYATMEVRLERMETRSDALDVRLYSVLARHIPPGVLRRGRTNSLAMLLDTTAAAPGRLEGVAERIGADSVVHRELRAAFIQQEDERPVRGGLKDLLLGVRDLLDSALKDD